MKKTIVLLIIIVTVFILASIYKINVIKKKRTLKAITISSEWEEYGKPVDVYKIKKNEFKNYTKISGILKNNSIVCEVPLTTKNLIKTAYSFFTESNLKGIVEIVSSTPNLNTGLYKVILKLEPSKIEPESIITAFINFKTIKNIISIPSSAIIKKDSESFVWKLNNGIVNLTKIKTTDSNLFNYTIVENGLEENSYIITKGIEILKENDAVRIHREF